MRTGLTTSAIKAKSKHPVDEEALNSTLDEQFGPDKPPHLEFLKVLRRTVKKKKQKVLGLYKGDSISIVDAWDKYVASPAGAGLKSMGEYREEWEGKLKGRSSTEDRTKKYTKEAIEKFKKEWILSQRRTAIRKRRIEQGITPQRIVIGQVEPERRKRIHEQEALGTTRSRITTGSSGQHSSNRVVPETPVKDRDRERRRRSQEEQGSPILTSSVVRDMPINVPTWGKDWNIPTSRTKESDVLQWFDQWGDTDRRQGVSEKSTITAQDTSETFLENHPEFAEYDERWNAMAQR